MLARFAHILVLIAASVTISGGESPEFFTETAEAVGIVASPSFDRGRSRFVEVRAGYHHTCGLTMAGGISCWGGTPDGEADAPGDDGFVQVATSRLFAGTTCGLTAVGSLKCWGIEEFGSAPAHREAATGEYVHVSTSGYTTCAVRDDGGIECFGDDTYGNVSTAPTSRGFVQVSTNAFFSCALQTDGEILCWGDYALGEPPSGPFTRVSAGTYHACGLRTNRTVECWGTNVFDQLNVPQGVYTDVEAGEYHVCAVVPIRRRRAVCWGRANTLEPVPAGGNHVQVTTGGYHNCVLERSGRIACWGAPEYSGPGGPAGRYGFGESAPDLALPPERNVVNAGSALRVAFRRENADGPKAFAPGYPQVASVSCTSPEDRTVGLPLERPGGPDSHYDPHSGTYSFEWKTRRSWEGSCRQLVLQFADGAFQRANFQFR